MCVYIHAVQHFHFCLDGTVTLYVFSLFRGSERMMLTKAAKAQISRRPSTAVIPSYNSYTPVFSQLYIINTHLTVYTHTQISGQPFICDPVFESMTCCSDFSNPTILTAKLIPKTVLYYVHRLYLQ